MASFTTPIRSEVLRKLAAHWERIRQASTLPARLMPARADFDPLEVKYALGYISLIQVFRAPLRFFFRLDGTKQVELFGIDCTGRFLDEAMPKDHAAMAGESYRDVVESRAPRYHLRKIRFHERIIDYEVLILPLSRDGEQADVLMTGIVPDYNR